MVDPLPTCILLIVCEINAEVENDWNTWYDEVHLPEALACPGVLCGARYKSEGSAFLTEFGHHGVQDSVSYITIYEIEGPEVLECPEFRAMAGWSHFSKHIKTRTQIFRQI